MIFCRHNFCPGLIWHRSRGRGKIYALSIHTLSLLCQWPGPRDIQLPLSVFLLSLLSSCKIENILQHVELGHNFLHIYWACNLGLYTCYQILNFLSLNRPHHLPTYITKVMCSHIPSMLNPSILQTSFIKFGYEYLPHTHITHTVVSLHRELWCIFPLCVTNEVYTVTVLHIMGKFNTNFIVKASQ